MGDRISIHQRICSWGLMRHGARTLSIRSQKCRGYPKWNGRRTIRLQSWRRSALKHRIVCQRDTVKIFAGRIRSLCALDLFIILEESRGWIRLRVVHRRPSRDAYRSRKAPFFPLLVLPTLSPTYFALYRYSLFLWNGPDNDIIVDGNSIPRWMNE